MKRGMYSNQHRGTDGTYPRVLKELAEKLLGPLSIISTAPEELRKPLMTDRGKTLCFSSKKGITGQLTLYHFQVKLGL